MKTKIEKIEEEIETRTKKLENLKLKKEFDAGWKEGNFIGFEEGKVLGYKKGYEEGYVAGQSPNWSPKRKMVYEEGYVAGQDDIEG